MTFMEIYLLAALIVLVLMAALWVLSLVLRDSSIVDIFWGTGFVILAWVYFALTPEGFLTRRLLISILTTIWGLRLSLYILSRNAGKGEDFRYARWRQEAGPKWWWFSFFKVFLLQGVIMWVVSAPLLGAQLSPLPDRLTLLDVLGVALWALGFFFEAVGDWQLARFKSNPDNKGQLLSTGLRRDTRHPNYFGDAAQWWGFYLIAAAGGAFWTIFSPIVMTFLLVRVSGVAMLQKSLKSSKPGYEEYIRSTSAFIPWFPRK
jgi:steroid 5-alpha reductase family enzyme